MADFCVFWAQILLAWVVLESWKSQNQLILCQLIEFQMSIFDILKKYMFQSVLLHKNGVVKNEVVKNSVVKNVVVKNSHQK